MNDYIFPRFTSLYKGVISLNHPLGKQIIRLNFRK